MKNFYYQCGTRFPTFLKLRNAAGEGGGRVIHITRKQTEMVYSKVRKGKYNVVRHLHGSEGRAEMLCVPVL